MGEVKGNNEGANSAHEQTALTKRKEGLKRLEKSHQLLMEISDRIYAWGMNLLLIRENKDYELEGHKDFESYLKSVKKRIKRRTAYNYMRCGECFAKRLIHIDGFESVEMLEETPYRNMLSISHIVLGKDDFGQWEFDDDTVLHWFHNAKELENDQLLIELKNHKLGKDPYKIEPDPVHIKFTAVGNKFWANDSGNIVTLSQFKDLTYKQDHQGLETCFKNKRVVGFLKVDE